MTETSSINDRFRHHPPATPGRAQEHVDARTVVHNAALEICTIVPPGREQALMLTKLEEAMFWANAGIARQE